MNSFPDLFFLHLSERIIFWGQKKPTPSNIYGITLGHRIEELSRFLQQFVHQCSMLRGTDCGGGIAESVVERFIPITVFGKFQF